MKISNSTKGAIIFMIGLSGFALIIPMMFYMIRLNHQHMLTWKNFTQIHWIGYAGLFASLMFIVCTVTGLYLTNKKSNNSTDLDGK